MYLKRSKFKSKPIPSSEITPESVYINRRDFMKAAAALGTGVLLASCAPAAADEPAVATQGSSAIPQDPSATSTTDLWTGSEVSGQRDAPTSFKDVTTYNNFYEFTLVKEEVAPMAENFKADPWSVEVSGLVETPTTFSIEDLLKNYEQEERVYRLRCVEGWSMVIPWTGFTLASLLKTVTPKSEAKYVRFETVYRPEEMEGQKSPYFPWPYTEGLRLDEAMNELTILATGLYDKSLPNQNGAPIRLVVPWKYGFKSIKSIIKIELVAEQPATLWNSVAPNEYGFYANVNPNVDHPRWSQASERRIGEWGRRDTLMFNGYEKDIAYLYEGMDLAVNY